MWAIDTNCRGNAGSSWNQGHFGYKRGMLPNYSASSLSSATQTFKTHSINYYNTSQTQHLLFTTPFISPITRCLVTDSTSVIPSAETKAKEPFFSSKTFSLGPMISRPQTRSSIWTLPAPVGLWAFGRLARHSVRKILFLFNSGTGCLTVLPNSDCLSISSGYVQQWSEVHIQY